MYDSVFLSFLFVYYLLYMKEGMTPYSYRAYCCTVDVFWCFFSDQTLALISFLIDKILA